MSNQGEMCHRKTCSNPNAMWFNHSTRMWYCESCAKELNKIHKAEAQRLYGHDLCTFEMTREQFNALKGEIAVREKELYTLKLRRDTVAWKFAADDNRMISEWRRNTVKHWKVQLIEPSIEWPDGQACVKMSIPMSSIESFEIDTGLRVHDDDKRERGMCYSRTSEKILDGTGGGYCVLKTPMLCSDLEWAEICSGHIPDKFKNM